MFNRFVHIALTAHFCLPGEAISDKIQLKLTYATNLRQRLVVVKRQKGLTRYCNYIHFLKEVRHENF